MVSVERTVVVGRSLEVVVDYLKDFARTEAWDPGTVRCVPLEPGPVAEGSTWRNTSVFRGRETELTYRLTRLEPARLTFIGTNRTATSTDDLTFREVDGGTSITYRADVTFHGLAKLAAPFLRGEFERLGDEVARTLPDVVDRL
ncbi:SRPBCC family protein [Streptacidiphilus sp. N1-3]|uniref:SRPBCC family protein n=1 Tax=Streptacidiphilus alkalitolerans TaxID=3342712 RepID=A0ABV6XE97_9ACTN